MHPLSKSGDPLAQSVEHRPFKAGVLGSSPKRITKNNPQETDYQLLADFLYLKCTTFAPLSLYNKVLQTSLNIPQNRLTLVTHSFPRITVLMSRRVKGHKEERDDEK